MRPPGRLIWGDRHRPVGPFTAYDVTGKWQGELETGSTVFDWYGIILKTKEEAERFTVFLWKFLVPVCFFGVGISVAALAYSISISAGLAIFEYSAIGGGVTALLVAAGLASINRIGSRYEPVPVRVIKGGRWAATLEYVVG